MDCLVIDADVDSMHSNAFKSAELMFIQYIINFTDRSYGQ